MRQSLLNDIIFKIVFGSQRNEAILRALVNAILGLEGADRIEQLFIINAFGDKLYHDERGVILDVKAVDAQGRRYNVEIQLNKKPDYTKRSIYYLTRLFNEQMQRGRSYEDLQRTIGISLLDHLLFDDQEPHHVFRLHSEALNLDLSDILELHYIELPKFPGQLPENPTALEKWMNLLRFAGLYLQGLAPIPAALQEDMMLKTLEEMEKAYGSTLERELEWAAHKAHHDEVTWIKHIEKLEARVEATIEALQRKVEQAEQAAEQAEQRAEQAEQRAEQAEQRAEQAEQRAEQAEQRAEQAEQRAEQAEQRAEQLRVEVRQLSNNPGHSPPTPGGNPG